MTLYHATLHLPGAAALALKQSLTDEQKLPLILLSPNVAVGVQKLVLQPIIDMLSSYKYRSCSDCSCILKFVIIAFMQRVPN